MSQPIPEYGQDDLERIIARDFAPAFTARVKGMPARYGIAPRQRNTLRVRMACPKCASGSSEGLQRPCRPHAGIAAIFRLRRSIRSTWPRAISKSGPGRSNMTGTSRRHG